MNKNKMTAKTFAQTNVQPNAWIVTNNRASANLPNDRGRRKVTNGKVYLKDSQEFEIELSNPTSNCVLAVILVNGKAISESGLVLRPAEHVYLDCFLSDKKKFKFSTYVVDNTLEANTAIQNNGNVEIHFYKEDAIKSSNIDKITKVIEHHYHHYPNYQPYQPYRPYWYGSPIYGGTYNGIIGTCTNTANTFTFDDGIFNTAITNCGGSFGTANSTFTSPTQPTNQSIGGISNLTSSNSMNFSNTSLGLSDTTQETGRIEKGDLSKSNFTNIEMEFEKNKLCTVSFQLLPDSKEPKTIKDFTENSYCSNCGRKGKGNENFCPACGTKLK